MLKIQQGIEQAPAKAPKEKLIEYGSYVGLAAGITMMIAGAGSKKTKQSTLIWGLIIVLGAAYALNTMGLLV